MGAGYQKDQAMIRNLGLSGTPHLFPGKKEGTEIELIIDRAYVTKPP